MSERAAVALDELDHHVVGHALVPVREGVVIEERRKDKAFMERLRRRHEQERALYERLAQ